MEWTSWLSLLDAHDYTIAREVIQRGVAAVFVLAFLSTYHQFPVLLGGAGACCRCASSSTGPATGRGRRCSGGAAPRTATGCCA